MHLPWHLRRWLRSLLKDWLFVISYVSTLVLCLTAAFALILLESVVRRGHDAVSTPADVVRIVDAYPGAFASGDGRMPTSVPNFVDREAAVDALRLQTLVDRRELVVQYGEQSTVVQGLRVTGNYFELFDGHHVTGRKLGRADTEADAEPVAIIGQTLARRLFPRHESPLGRPIIADGVEYSIVGVSTRALEEVEHDVEVWTPWTFTSAERSNASRHGGGGESYARLASASPEIANAQLAAVNASVVERHPVFSEFVTSARFHSHVESYRDQYTKAARGHLRDLLVGAALLVILGAGSSLNLATVRATQLQPQLSLCLALGGGIAHVVTRVVFEHVCLLLLAVIGAALGVWAVVALLQGMDLSWQFAVVWADVLSILGTTVLLLVLLALSLSAGAATSAVRLSGPERALLGGARVFGPRLGVRRLRSALVVVQVALSFALLAGALSVGESVSNALEHDKGFEEQGLLTGRIIGGDAGVETSRRLRAAALGDFVRSEPGVQSASIATSLPYGPCCAAQVIRAESAHFSEARGASTRVVVDAFYFATLGVEHIEGRLFDTRDTPDSLPVVVVDQTAATAHWSGDSPIGQRVYIGDRPSELSKLYEVVGVVGDHDLRGEDSVSRTNGTFFFPLAQSSEIELSSLGLAVRAESGAEAHLAASLPQRVGALDRGLGLAGWGGVSAKVDRASSPARLARRIVEFFALSALLLAFVGIYSVLGYAVLQQREALAVRLALGGQPVSLATGVLGRGLALCCVGTLAGVLVTGFVANAVRATDGDVVLTSDHFLLSGVVLITASVIAASLPALRVLRISPAEAMRGR